MLIVGLTRVKNEQDIIEAFVRHHLVLFNRIYVLDDLSTDRTKSILNSLYADGLPIEILTEDTIGLMQADSVSYALRRIFDETAPDWIFPLDADEFVEVESRARLEIILRQQDRPLQLHWNNYCWREKNSDHINPVLRMVDRTPTRRVNYKVAVPRAFAMAENVSLFEGNHLLLRNGVAVDTVEDPRLRIAHFPIRSVEQFASKIILGTARYAMQPTAQANVAYHYSFAEDKLLQGMRSFRSCMEEQSRNFSLAPSEQRDAPYTNHPFQYLGGELAFTAADADIISSLGAFVRQLSAKIAEQATILNAFGDADGDAGGADETIERGILSSATIREARSRKRAQTAEAELAELQKNSFRPKWLARRLLSTVLRRLSRARKSF